MTKRWPALVFLLSLRLFCQSNSGELRVKVIDPSGAGTKATVQLSSAANEYRKTLVTGDKGSLDVQRLPYGIYELEIDQPGFAPLHHSIEIRSSLAIDLKFQLKLAAVNQSVMVSTAGTLIDPAEPGSVRDRRAHV